MLQVAQDGQGLFDQAVARLPGEGGHEADTAGVVLVARVVHSLLGRVGRQGRSTHRLSRRRRGSFLMPRDDVGPLRTNFRAGYMMEGFSGTWMAESIMRT
ncbi:hypothetical protein GCM10010420_51240 [Streptomyces glaucosporus]|uniref:Uncharacterized protein n=1 Tax=Streptomyces glaucosporus TaxID=284044 RepID=A0ABN3IVI4_9ACTN